MAIESRRLCGYRKLNGLYLVADGFGVPCDRLPFPLDVCPTCSHGLKYSRGWTWVDVGQLFGHAHRLWDNGDTVLCPEAEQNTCYLCANPSEIGKAGLVWIGEKFYPTPEHFILEGKTLGISRRIKTIPHGFKLGQTWVLLAHIKAIKTVIESHSTLDFSEPQTIYKPGIFQVFKPQRIEKIITESQSKDAEEMEALAKRGITPVIVPDDDSDHQGSVWDKQEQLEL